MMMSSEEFSFDENEDSDYKSAYDNDISYVENDEDGLPAGHRLINAILERKLSEAECLIKNGADVNYRMKKSGWTPLMYAASIGAKEPLHLLLKNGADPNCHFEGRTVLMCLCESTSFDSAQLVHCLNLLIEAGADVNANDFNSVTALMMAVRRDHSQLISCLLFHGADLEAVSNNGWSAVFYAVNSGNLEAVRMLKDCGSNLSLKDKDGQTLCDIASADNFIELSEIICGDAGDDHYNKELHRNSCLDSYQFVMSEMPDGKLSHFNGFYDDALQTIAKTGLKHLIPLFIEKKIGYGQFLIFTDEDWKKIGVEYSYDRKRLIWYANSVLKYSWNPSVILSLEKRELNLFWLAQIMSNNIRIIHILKANLHVCMRELYSREISYNNELIPLNDCMINLKILKESLEKLPSVVEKIAAKHNIVCVDYICPNSRKTYITHLLFIFHKCYRLILSSSIFTLFNMFEWFKRNFQILKREPNQIDLS